MPLTLNARPKQALVLFEKDHFIPAKKPEELLRFAGRTARHLLQKWVRQGFVAGADPPKRVQKYKLKIIIISYIYIIFSIIQLYYMNKQETFIGIYAKNLSIKIILILSGILCLCVIPHYANYWLWKHPYCQILAELFRWHALPILAVGIIFIVSAMAFDRIGEPHEKSHDIRDYLFIFPTDNIKCIWLYILLGYGLLCRTHSLSNVLLLLLLATLLGYLIYARNFNYALLNLQEEYTPNDKLKDVPIQTIEQDKLGRSLFINTTAEIIKSLRGANNRLLLDGDWGSGKTSIINCIEHIISTEKSNIIFCRVNPWSNNTREKFIAALIGELEGFCQKTPPSFSISSCKFSKA